MNTYVYSVPAGYEHSNGKPFKDSDLEKYKDSIYKVKLRELK